MTKEKGADDKCSYGTLATRHIHWPLAKGNIGQKTR